MLGRAHRLIVPTAVLTALVALAPSALASAAKLPFKPGHYVGYTNQTCPAEPLPAGVCQPGEKLPISFTVSSHRVRQLKAVVVDRCEGGLPAIVHTMNYPHAVPLVTPGEEHGPIKGLVIDDRQSVPASIPAIMDEVVGLIHRNQASGILSSSIFVNESGQPDPKGNMACAGAKVHWHAKFHP